MARLKGNPKGLGFSASLVFLGDSNVLLNALFFTWAVVVHVVTAILFSSLSIGFPRWTPLPFLLVCESRFPGGRWAGRWPVFKKVCKRLQGVAQKKYKSACAIRHFGPR